MGWNVSYDWMASDFEISASYLIVLIFKLKDYYRNYNEISYEATYHVIGEIVYGGKILYKKDFLVI